MNANTISRRVVVNHASGLHARPLARFVKLASAFEATIQVTNMTRGAGPASGASPLKLMLLAVSQGHEILLEAEGPEATEAIAALEALIERNFKEVS